MAEVETTTDTSEVITKPVDEVVEDGAGDKPATNGDVETPPTEGAVDTEVKENGDVANEEEPDAAVAVSEDAVEAEPVVEVPPKVILHQFPPGTKIPSLSPFCLKVETFLRIKEIPYENQHGYKMGKKGKLPWIEYQGERKTDSKFIIEYITEKFEADLDNELSSDQVSLGRAITRMLEENTYWSLIYNRYVDNFTEYKKLMTQATGIGFNVSQKMFQRKMRSNLDGHGMGRHAKEEVYKIAEEDLKALSTLLGEKEFLLGDKISTADCTLFGVCANILYSGMESPMKTYILENATNVKDLCDKIRASYWADWVEVVEEVEKPSTPALKKGFSFRKKKSVPKKVADAESDEASKEGAADTAPTDGDVTGDEAKVEDKPATEEAPVTDTPTEETASPESESTEPVPETTEEVATEPKAEEAEPKAEEAEPKADEVETKAD